MSETTEPIQTDHAFLAFDACAAIFCHLRGPVLKCRAKGSKSAWKTL